MKLRSLGLVLFALVLTCPVLADDWPQWRGPNRNGISQETNLLTSWPEGGPKQVWMIKTAGIGFSSPAIIGDKLYCMGSRGKDCVMYCLNVKDGSEVWSTSVGPTFDGIIAWGGGPRSGPTVDGKLVYGLSGNGVLACVNAADGKLVWQVDFVKDFGGAMMSNWGYSESVLVDGNHLLCAPGSATKGTFAALDKATGKVVWFSSELTNKASYSSLMPAKFGGVEQYVGVSYDDKNKTVVASGIAAKDGKILWTHSLDTGKIDVAACSPIIKNDQVFLSIGDSIGSYMLKVTKEGAGFQVKDLYEDVRFNMKNMHGGVVLIGDYIYGQSETFNWMCLEWSTGNKVWFERFKLETNASGSICAADGLLYCYSDLGEMALVKASPDGWDEKGRFSLPVISRPPAESRARKIWTHPVIANGRLYLRDAENLFCFDIQAK